MAPPRPRYWPCCGPAPPRPASGRPAVVPRGRSGSGTRGGGGGAVEVWAGADSARPATRRARCRRGGEKLSSASRETFCPPLRRGAVRCGRVAWRRVAPLRSQRGALRRRGGHARRQPAAAL